jgi:opacity protein-like surface antigen
MKRFGQLVLVLCVMAASFTGTAWAQAERAMAVQGTVGATFGNNTGASFGGEFDYKINTEWELFLEAGQMRNVASGQMDDDAQLIATSIGASAEAAERANYYTVGAKYLLVPFGGGYVPYVGVGFGAARVKKETVFSINGQELSELELLIEHGVQLGADLAGATVKPLFTAAFGVTRDFAGRAFMDISYRYGLIFSDSDTIEDDKGLNTQRLQLGIGVRF